MPGPRATRIEPTAGERQRLLSVSRAPTSACRDAKRAHIVLLAADGSSNADIARALNVTEMTVRKWRNRYGARGREGLADLPRRGRPPRYDGVQRCLVVSAACQPVTAADCRTRWTPASLRDVLDRADLCAGISTRTVARILEDADLRPHRMRLWLHSPDPDFRVKVNDVVGLYLEPPRPGRVVVSVDEKTGMQALGRRFAGRLASPGQDARREFEYRRNGVRCLFAAFVVSSGEVLGRCTRRRTTADLLAFMDEVVAERFPTEEVHVVWDNLNTHHGPHWHDFNRRHGGRFTFHYTPIHASWVNQVELWFSILTRRVLRCGSFRTCDELCERVMAFVDRWNSVERKPFRWTFTGYPLQTGLAEAA